MQKTVVLDANLLVLFVVGLTDKRFITVHKRLKAYSIADFELLERYISVSAGVAVTPNILTEASNLLRQINEPAKSLIGSVFCDLIKKLSEFYIQSDSASSRQEFLRLGLTDCAVLEVSRADTIILSADLGLYLAALTAGYEALNFNHYRDENL